MKSCNTQMLVLYREYKETETEKSKEAFNHLDNHRLIVSKTQDTMDSLLGFSFTPNSFHLLPLP